jgi:hypothetical protein
MAARAAFARSARSRTGSWGRGASGQLGDLAPPPRPPQLRIASPPPAHSIRARIPHVRPRGRHGEPTVCRRPVRPCGSISVIAARECPLPARVRGNNVLPSDRRRPLRVLAMTTLHEHLGLLVRYAPPGTLVPVDSLAEFLRVYSEPGRPAPAGLSLGEVAERFARVVGGQRKAPQEGTVRKWIRRGLRGVKLKAFRAGRHLRVLESDFDAFVHALTELPAAPAARRDPVGNLPAGAGQPDTELEAYLTHYRQGTRPRTRPRTPGRGSLGDLQGAIKQLRRFFPLGRPWHLPREGERSGLPRGTL